MKLHLLSGGRLRMRRSIYHPAAGRDETIDLPVSCALLKHAQGLVLFDTGCHPSAASDAEARWGSMARLMVPRFEARDTVVAQLARADVAAADVDVVVCSHLHPDHCGCNEFFPRATVLAQAAEIAAARAANAPSRGYLAVEFEHPNPIRPVHGDHDLFGDGRITLLHMPGHTPGMMAAHVVLDRDGPFVLASDAVALRAHLDQGIVPKNTWDVAKHETSIAAVARLRRDGATVVFGHDLAQWETLRTGANYYA
jgi:N-acyl homoserine lactone hydrolase